MSSGESNVTVSDIMHNVFQNSSRYINLDLAKYDRRTVVNVPDKLNITPNRNNPDKTIVITGKLVNRLDLVSLQYYTTPKYWWVLAYYNNIENPFILPYGTILKIPAYTTLLLNDIIKS